MKKFSNFKSSSTFSTLGIVIGLSLAASLPASAVLPFTMSTNGSGVISGGSWSGNGTIQPNVSPGTFPPLDVDVLVQDFTSGTLAINAANLFPDTRINPATGVTHSVVLTGGTGDLRLANSNAFDDGASKYNAVGLQGFLGVTKIVWTMTYTLPIAGRNDDPTSLSSRPIGGALGLVQAGSGLGLTDFNVTLQLGGVSSTPTSNGTFTPGVPANSIPFATAGWDSRPAGATNFVSADGFTGLIDLASASSGVNFLMVMGYDYNGSGNGYTAADADLVYVESLTFTIEAAAGKTFQAIKIFTISMDGQQYANVNNAIPEPTAALLVGLTFVGGLIGWRRRRIF